MRARTHGKAGCVLAVAVALAGCGGGEMRRFPLRDATWKDGDTRPVYVACDKRPNQADLAHVACSPDPYVSPLAWDAADNTIFRPISKVFAVDPPKEARNVNAFDEVPDSAWFTNRVGNKKPTQEELLRGACRPEDMIDGADADPATWVIDKGKPNGATPGFRVKIEGKNKYMFKADLKEEPERPSAASTIGAAIYHAVGFNTSCEQIIYVDPKKLKLRPGLKFTANDGVTRPFDAKALAKVVAETGQRGETRRFQASAWIPGYLLGPFKYEHTRSDDPNDVIPHEDRRDLRGARVLAAWLHHFDAREQNSMDSWIATNPQRGVDSSPGYIRHYYLDTSDCLGSLWAIDGISRRLGHSYILDFGDVASDFFTLGVRVRPWEKEVRAPEGSPGRMFGYFHWREFDPDAWKNEYPNPAFSRATEHDNAWMARILSRFDRADIKALVSLGKFTNPEADDWLTEVLEMRLRKIVDRYLFHLSPISDLRMEGADVLCGVDLARRRGARPDGEFQYSAWSRGRWLRMEVRPEGGLCVQLPHVAADAGPRDDDPSRYVVVSIADGLAKGRLDAHLYDLGPARGFRLVGLERPDP